MTDRLILAMGQDVFPAGQVGANLATIERHLGSAAGEEADVLVLPELATSGYFTDAEIEELAEPIDGPTITAVRSMVVEAGVALCVGYPELDPASGQIHNSAVVIGSDGEILANHRKTHLWARENERFVAGDDPVTMTELGGFRVAVLICYEVEFPELVRRAAIAGADLLLVPTAVPDLGTGSLFSEQIVGARATENNLFIVYANHAGIIDHVPSLGASVIAAPLCRIVVSAGEGPSFQVVTLERSELTLARDRLPYLRDRRPDLY